MAEAKICPVLPPLPRINPLTHTIAGFSYQVCLDSRCAFHPVCSILIKECADSKPGSSRFLTGLKSVFAPDKLPAKPL